MSEANSTSSVAIESLRRSLHGDVYADDVQRGLYATDASVYEQQPRVVVRPAEASDLPAIMRWAAKEQIPVTCRGAGTSLAGQTTGGGAIVDLGRHLNQIESINIDTAEAVVQPGVILDDLNDRLAADGLFFAPDTSTSNRCMLGGMIGNNSCGAHSVAYGTTRDHIRQLDVVLADGSTLCAKPLEPAEWAAKLRLENLEGQIYRGLDALLREHRDAIQAAYPKAEVNRRNTGYALDIMAQQSPWTTDGPACNLIPLLCGSEGSLAMTARATLALTPRPRHRLLCAVHFHDLVAACQASVLALQHNCHAAELIDGAIIEATKHNREQQRNRFWIEGDPGAICVIELEDSDEIRLRERMQQLVTKLQAAELGHAWPIIEAAQSAQVWSLRKAGLGLLMGRVQSKQAVAVIEDTAVAPADLPAYIADVQSLMQTLDLNWVAFGHAAAGELHLRPELDLRLEEDVQRFKDVAKAVAELVASYGGSLSGEHGDGRVRAPYIETVLGSDMLHLCEQVKDLFDPDGILNPGKIVRPAAIDSDWRMEPGQAISEPATVFDWSKDRGLLAATEKCNGAGACRKSPGRGTMCPSYHVTLEELHSTRGRANTLRQALLHNSDPGTAMQNDAVLASLDLCLSCKACTAECPANVDMARLKAEVLQRRHDVQGISNADKFFGRFEANVRRLSKLPRMLQGLANLGSLKKRFGIHPDRSLPLPAAQNFSKWWEQHGRPPLPDAKAVILLVDEFTNHLEPEIAIAAVEVLEACQFAVHVVTDCSSQRSQISRGLLREAQTGLRNSLQVLTSQIADASICALEPSALAAFIDEAPDLVGPDMRAEAEAIAGRCLLLDEFLVQHKDRLQQLSWKSGKEPHVMFHGHCHQKALLGTKASLEVLQCIPGATVEEIASGCCGMAGSFGYEADHYETSMAIGEQILFPAVNTAKGALICSTGTSCRHQILDGTGKEAKHPIVLLREAMSG